MASPVKTCDVTGAGLDGGHQEPGAADDSENSCRDPERGRAQHTMAKRRRQATPASARFPPPASVFPTWMYVPATARQAAENRKPLQITIYIGSVFCVTTRLVMLYDCHRDGCSLSPSRSFAHQRIGQ